MGTSACGRRHARSRHEVRDPIHIHKKDALMVEQLRRPTDQVEVYWFSEQPNGYVTDRDLDKYDLVD
jgi:hypothetical protein